MWPNPLYFTLFGATFRFYLAYKKQARQRGVFPDVGDAVLRDDAPGGEEDRLHGLGPDAFVLVVPLARQVHQNFYVLALKALPATYNHETWLYVAGWTLSAKTPKFDEI